ncbi:transmembrane protein 214-B-like isoform X2 [Babylonia areolata]|uniref:transmembrane protein 214-B-like isoform X2 n=1 Tax=Babylonia areolata TaxID=304850 RepID=UPI003FD4905B
MASAGQWEVVGKTKKGKAQSPALTKSQKKTFVERMPKIETRDPVKEDRTIYDAFNASESRSTASGASDSAGKQRGPHSQTTTKKKKVEQNGRRETSSKSPALDSALAQINHTELESVVGQSQLHFPDNQDVWLKDLASYINLKLEKVTDADPTFKDKPKDYPQNQLSAACQKVINSLFKKCSKQSLDHVFYHSVQCMISQSGKGLSTAGYKVFLQVLAFHKPNVVQSKSEKYLELIKTSVNRPAQCLSILWAIGQCGMVDLCCGLRVWLDLMLPCLGVRSVAAFPVEYLENLFVWHKDPQKAYGEVGLREYFNLLDTIFSPTINIQGDLRRRLQAVYPDVKNIAYGASPSTNLRNFFASYLRRAEPNCSAAMKQEVLLCLVLCLGTDKHSWSTWCQMYTKHLPQSGVLLQHLMENWELLSKSERHLLRETLRSFAVTNEELVAQRNTAMEGFDICYTTTKELLQKMNQSHFPWGLLVFFFTTVFAAIVIYDIVSSPNIKASRTVRFLEDYGILTVLEQALGRITTFVYLVMSWCEENFPRYYHWLKETVGPGLRWAWQAGVEAVVSAVEWARPHCLWAFSKTQQGLVWVYKKSPDMWDQYGAWLWLCWDFLKDYTHWIWKHVLHWALVTQHWLQDHVIPSNLSTDRLQETAVWSVQQMHNYTLSFFSWCNRLLFSSD